MNTLTIHAELHPRLLTDARMRREREAIAARHAPSARELFANREQLLDGTAAALIASHRRANVERRVRSTKLSKAVDSINRITDRLRGGYYRGRGA
ncbi:hypothetical protein [Microbacterium sp. K24]|uniref:hypothetical protein n=1 Tax=Microbacterium sp. K24 TaxID=2305446 RepID=UPI00109C9049|nr:hypothetical protein [Microbacterium sp. K24]